MAAKIRASEADIVHVHLPNPTSVLAYLASGHSGRLVVTYHSDTIRQAALGALFEPILHRFLRRAAAIIVTSPNYLQTSPVLARYHDRCHVVPYGIAVEDFQSYEPYEVNRIRKKHGDRLLIAVGRLVYYKGFAYLVQAMKDVRGRLLLIGDGPLRSSLEDLAAQCGVSDRVSFLGELQNEEIIPYYHASDVFVLPSIARTEAFGIVQIEAMAAGKPVVNTNLDSGVPFVSRHEVTGLTVPPKDSVALAHAVNRLLDDEPLRASYSRAALHRARSEFRVDKMAARTEAIYEAVLGSLVRREQAVGAGL
jgi:rhamnosyl/mannosyltransferase